MRHRKTLKRLELLNCSINVKDYGRKPAICCWAHVYKRLANALTELVELKVEFWNVERIPYISSTGPSPRPLLPRAYYQLKKLEGTGQDAEAVEEFKATVKNRGIVISTMQLNDDNEEGPFYDYDYFY